MAVRLAYMGRVAKACVLGGHGHDDSAKTQRTHNHGWGKVLAYKVEGLV